MYFSNSFDSEYSNEMCYAPFSVIEGKSYDQSRNQFDISKIKFLSNPMFRKQILEQSFPSMFLKGIETCEKPVTTHFYQRNDLKI